MLGVAVLHAVGVAIPSSVGAAVNSSSVGVAIPFSVWSPVTVVTWRRGRRQDASGILKALHFRFVRFEIQFECFVLLKEKMEKEEVNFPSMDSTVNLVVCIAILRYQVKESFELTPHHPTHLD